MKNPMPRWIALAALAALFALASGCAPKRAPAPPPAPPAAHETPAPTPPPAPPQETPPAPTPQQLSSSDLQPAFFDFDSYALRDDARTALDHDAKLLRDNADAKLTVEGHCDERGTAEYNQALGERRAQAARDYLVNAGIDASRLKVVSYGKERPFDPGHDESAWSKNRRAHFVIQ